jgi:hypothetical protein
MKINEVTDITRATPQNRVYDPAKIEVEELVDELHEEEDELEENAKINKKPTK